MQMLIYKGLCDLTIGKKTTSLTMIDDCGNKWNCITIFGTRPHHHITTSSLVEDGKEWYMLADLRKVSWLKLGFHMLA